MVCKHFALLCYHASQGGKSVRSKINPGTLTFKELLYTDDQPLGMVDQRHTHLANGGTMTIICPVPQGASGARECSVRTWAHRRIESFSTHPSCHPSIVVAERIKGLLQET